jgi:ATP-dependent DNA ligase
MLAKAVDGIDKLPDPGSVLFEPKWDGFRCIVFRDHDEVELGSRNERPLTRYFPELLPVLRDALPDRCVVDGEVVLTSDRGLDFDGLQQRIHPADSRVRMLAAKTPASFVAFDLLAEGDDDLTERPFSERRARLEHSVRGGGPPPAVHLTPITADTSVAADWFTRFEGAGLDGVVAKPAAGTYRPDERVMYKIKHRRTADCVVAGYRSHKSGDGVGSLLLGVYDDDGTLHHVGVCSAFTAARRRALVDELGPYAENALDDHPWREWADAMAHEAGGRMPGAPSRWNAAKDQTWTPLRPELVVEVTFQHLERDRFRHPASFIRWRPDRTPESCTYAQLDVAVPFELTQVFGA